MFKNFVPHSFVGITGLLVCCGATFLLTSCKQDQDSPALEEGSVVFKDEFRVNDYKED